MKVTINTDKLKAMLSTVVKGVGNGKLIPITEYLKVELTTNNELCITATDLNNYITVSESSVEGESGTFLVLASNFVKLITKTTKNNITFETKDTELKIKGNGNYTLPILNEEFPQYDFNMEGEFVYEKANIKTLKSVLATNKYSVAQDMVMPCLTGYLIGNKCITTDGVKMCINDTKLFSQNLLIPPTLVDLLNTLTGEEVEIYYTDNKLLFQTNTVTIYGAELSGKDSYPNIEPLVEREYPYNVSVPKATLLSVLDRLSIFTNPYDNNGIKFTFLDSCLQVSDLKDNNIETINYNEPVQVDNCTVAANINYIIDLIHAIQGVDVNLYFGDGATLKIQDNNVTELIGLMNIGDDN